MTDDSNVLTVTQLNHQIKQALSSGFGKLWVEGEIGDIARPTSGHIYLTLKDRQSQLRAIIWNRNAQNIAGQLEDGQTVLCRGSLDAYPPRGTYQLVVDRVEFKGMGQLQMALERLRRKLSAEGLFDRSRKRPLPRYPRRIGVISSPTGAAIRDFLQVVLRRWPGAEVLVIPSNVQGGDAAPSITNAIETAQRIVPLPDLLVIARGGGSLEDLWGFNDERVVRAVAASGIPVISAIGHEIDITLTDMASDRRALTPSEAGELAVASREDVAGVIDQLNTQLHREIRQRLDRASQQFDELQHRPVLQDPHAIHVSQRDALQQLSDRMQQTVMPNYHRLAQGLASASAVLNAVSPLGVLSRGYSIARHQGSRGVIRSAAEVRQGDNIDIVVADGEIHATVSGASPKDREDA